MNRQKSSENNHFQKVIFKTDHFCDSESPLKKATPNSKVARKWDDSKVTAHDLASFDYSSDKPGAENSTTSKADLVATEAMGTRGKNGFYEVADYKIKESEESETTPAKNGFYSLLSKLSLGSKALSKEDLKPALLMMKEQLMFKNVAKEIAEKVCEGVGNSLEAKLLGSFSSIRLEVKKALEISLVKILTPKTSTDLLLEIARKKSDSLGLAVGANKPTITPYSITFVGVNGVGKSTNLSKVAFWLLQNKLRVLIAACDTFRSGAVEQLRIHVRNLGKLGEAVGGIGEEKDGIKMIELFEKGYGKDAAGIAKDAIAYGKFFLFSF